MSDKSKIGTQLEYNTIAKLVKEGYHVAKSVDPQCPFDMVAVSDKGQVRFIDVKTRSERKTVKPNWNKSRFINRVHSIKQKEFKKNTGIDIEIMVVGDE
jgi:Holliday junction resolvase